MFLVPLPGHGTIRFPDALIGAVRAVFLPGGSHSVFFPAPAAFVRATYRTIRLSSFGAEAGPRFFLTSGPAIWAIPGTGAAIKDGAALAAGPRQHDNGHTITQAVLSVFSGSRRWG